MWRNLTCASLILLVSSGAEVRAQAVSALVQGTQHSDFQSYSGSGSPSYSDDVATPSSVLPKPIATRQTLFSIPFHVDPPLNAAQAPLETQLFVSGDRGVTWYPYAKADPRQEHFMFRAGGDGEYWFAVRTLDHSGRLRPATIPGPGLRVVVDTAIPKFKLDTEIAETGQITAKWEIDDPQVDPNTLTIQFRVSDFHAWQGVAVDREKMRTIQSTHIGEVAWLAPATDQPIQVRAEVSDLAGNKAVNHARVVPMQTADLTSRTPEVASGLASNTGFGQASGETSTADRDTRWPADYDTSAIRSHHQPVIGSSVGTQSAQLVGMQPVETGRATTAQVNPLIGNRFVAPAETSTTDTLGDRSGTESSTHADTLPVSTPVANVPRPMFVNSRSLELDYDVTSVSPAGVSRVELWATLDNGRTWQKIAVDNDTQSPITAKVAVEGVYGFRVVVANASGLGGEPPRSGEPAEIQVGVDLTQPMIRIVAIEPGTGPESGHLIVRWQASDKWLARKPISLLWSQTPDGPWTSVVRGLDNSGRYAWPVGQGLSQNIYLRLEARDEAGNVGVFQTSHAVSGDQFRPASHIRGVHPVSRSRQVSPPQHYWR